MNNKLETRITTATAKALKLIEEGNCEVWSADLGDLTKKQLITVMLRLDSQHGVKSVFLKNSLDNGFAITN